MSVTVSLDIIFLFILLLTFMLNLISYKLPIVCVLSVGITTLIIIPNVGSTYATSNTIGIMGILMTLFTFITTIIVLIEVIRE